MIFSTLGLLGVKYKFLGQRLQSNGPKWLSTVSILGYVLSTVGLLYQRYWMFCKQLTNLKRCHQVETMPSQVNREATDGLFLCCDELKRCSLLYFHKEHFTRK